jgi:hypothetical protein
MNSPQTKTPETKGANMDPMTIAAIVTAIASAATAGYQGYQADQANDTAVSMQNAQNAATQKRQARQDQLAEKKYLASLLDKGQNDNRDTIAYLASQYTGT